MRVIEAEKLIMRPLGNGDYIVTREAIINAPTFEAEPIRYGEWLPVDDKNDAFDCSECDVMVSKRHNYCPKCGAKMGIKGYYHGKIVYKM